MSDKIVQLNEEVIKGQIKELVRGSVEETLNELLEAEAEKLTQAARYERTEQRQGYRNGHYSRNLTTTSGDVKLNVPRLKGVTFETAMALAAMTGDWDTFSSLAQQAVYDLDDESASAFSSVMNNFAAMSQSVVGNTNEIIGAFSQMGEALSRAMQGLTTSRYSAAISGGSVSGSGKNTVDNLLSDMFESAKSDYGSGGTTLDSQIEGWQKRLQDIADSYASTSSNLDELRNKQASIGKQIDSINGQISLLESLKNAPIRSSSQLVSEIELLLWRHVATHEFNRSTTV